MTIAERDKLFEFLETSGYGDDDVLAFNPETGEVSTRNGGKYQISPNGKVLHLQGPSPDPTDRL